MADIKTVTVLFRAPNLALYGAVLPWGVLRTPSDWKPLIYEEFPSDG